MCVCVSASACASVSLRPCPRPAVPPSPPLPALHPRLSTRRPPFRPGRYAGLADSELPRTYHEFLGLELGLQLAPIARLQLSAARQGHGSLPSSLFAAADAGNGAVSVEVAFMQLYGTLATDLRVPDAAAAPPLKIARRHEEVLVEGLSRTPPWGSNCVSTVRRCRPRCN